MPRNRSLSHNASKAGGLLVNAVYSSAVGHVVEGLSIAAAFRHGNPQMPIGVAINAEAPVRLAECVEDLRLEIIPVETPPFESRYAIGHCPEIFSDRWKYVFSLRGEEHVGWPFDRGVKAFHVALKHHLRPKVAAQLTGQWPQQMPTPKWAPLHFKIPSSDCAAADQAYPIIGSPRICILTGSGTHRKAPLISSWQLVMEAFLRQSPSAEFVVIGSLECPQGTQNITHADLAELQRRVPNCRVAFDICILQQLRIAQTSQLFISPHSGMAFAVQCVGTPWLAVSGGQHYEYFTNGAPFATIYPECPLYPCHAVWGKVMLKECADIVDGVSGVVSCLSESAMKLKIPDIVAKAEQLMTGRIQYASQLEKHTAAMRALGVTASFVHPSQAQLWPNWN